MIAEEHEAFAHWQRRMTRLLRERFHIR